MKGRRSIWSWLLTGLLLTSTLASFFGTAHGNNENPGMRDLFSGLAVTSGGNSLQNMPICVACQAGVQVLFTVFQTGLRDLAFEAITFACTAFELQTWSVCKGLLKNLKEQISFLYDNFPIEQSNVCGILLSDYGCALGNPRLADWSIPASRQISPSTLNSPIPVNGPTLKVLHLTDIHWDPNYTVGGWADCKEPLCCQSDSTPTTTSFPDAQSRAHAQAKKWGDYRNCDLPLATIENAFQHIAATHKDISHVVWTGDLPPHIVWNTNTNENLMILDTLVDLLHKYFPNIMVFPTFGNHETHPLNDFPPPEIRGKYNISWLYDEADKKWSYWLPNSTHETIRYGGYYTALARPGLRIVSMNNNFCYILNTWLLYNATDPGSGLAWLQSVLEKAELVGEKVHIISHVPPGSHDCWTVYTREYARIINRFRNTVTGQFYGHTHWDQFSVFYDRYTKEPTNVAYVGPSLTSFDYMDPAYRIYIVDGDRLGSTRSVLDHVTWSLNLTEANLVGTPTWRKSYSAKETYGLPSLTPTDWSNLSLQMRTNKTLYETYTRLYNRLSDSSYSEEACEGRCRAQRICEMFIAEDYDTRTRCIESTLATLQRSV